MSQVNTFMIVSKDSSKVCGLYNFIRKLELNTVNDEHNEIRLDSLGMSNNSDWFMVMGELRNTYASNLKFWFEKTKNEHMLDDCYFFIEYELKGYIELVNIFSGEEVKIYDILDGETEKEKELESILPMDYIIDYFNSMI